jgi:hypothetical protein
MTDITNKKKEDEILFAKNLTAFEVTNNIISKIKNCNEKILYFNYTYTEEELKNKFKIFNKKNIIIVNKRTVTVDDLEKYIKYSKPSYLCIDYFTLTKVKKRFKIENKTLRYVLDKLKKYMAIYDTVFIVVINEKSE